MATRLDQRISRLRIRKSDPIKGVRTRSVSLSKAESKFDSAQDALDYITESMIPVDEEYTNLTFEECDRVQEQIQEACRTESVGVCFRHQGSVTNDTHIRFFSDIDLLVITDRFHDLKAPLEPDNPYEGDPMGDLKEIRAIVEDRLSSSFPKATVDKSGNKAVSISGGSLRRKIDVIAASWLETTEFRRTQKEEDKGVKILDLDGPKRVANFPFFHNREINNKDTATSGALKALIRFVKSARYDADETINFSSYDIAALCYNMPTEDLRKSSTSNLALAHAFLTFSDKVQTTSTLQQSLYVPNKTRLIFGENGASSAALKKLNEEIFAILQQTQHSRGLQ